MTQSNSNSLTIREYPNTVNPWLRFQVGKEFVLPEPKEVEDKPKVRYAGRIILNEKGFRLLGYGETEAKALVMAKGKR